MFWYTHLLILWIVCYTELHVQGVSGVITVTTSAVTGIPNQQPLTLRCNYTADEPVRYYIWDRKIGRTVTKVVDGSVSDRNAVFRVPWLNKGVFVGDFTSTLDIQLPANYVTSSFAGTYVCQVTGVVTTKTEVTASVLSAPTISDIPSPYRVIASTRLRIDCSSYTTVVIPSSTSYTWTKGKSFVDSTNGILDINSISRSQAGQYTCTATNSQGSDSATTTVDVQYSPTISDIPSPYQVVESTRLEIDCSSYTTVGNPPATSYTWTKGGSAVASTDGVLDISSISRDQAGQYICTATNTLTPTRGSQQQGTATGQVNVDVQYAPTINIPTNKDVTENTSPNIDCSSNITPGNPSSTSYSWTGPDGYSKTGAVLDRTVNRTQGGQYTCTATNTAGLSDTATISINVQISPETNAEGSASNVTAAVAGGVVAGILVVIIIVVIVVLYKRGTFRTIASSQRNRGHNEQNVTVSSDPGSTYSDLDHGNSERRTYTELKTYQNVQASAGDGDVAVYEGIQEKSYENIQMPSSENTTADNNKEPMYQNTGNN